METSHDDLKDNTIIVGNPHLPLRLHPFTHPKLLSLWCFWRSRKEKGLDPYLLCTMLT